jgi:hypothetical protein
VPDLEAHRQRWASGNTRGLFGGAANARGEPFDWRYGKKLLQLRDGSERLSHQP